MYIPCMKTADVWMRTRYTRVFVMFESDSSLFTHQATHRELWGLPGRQPLPGRDEVSALNVRPRAVHFRHTRRLPQRV